MGKPRRKQDLASRGLAVEERTLHALEGLDSPARAVLVGAYLVGAYWSWWLTLALVALVVWRLAFPAVTLAAAVAGALALVALAGYLVKGALERRYGGA